MNINNSVISTLKMKISKKNYYKILARMFINKCYNNGTKNKIMLIIQNNKLNLTLKSDLKLIKKYNLKIVYKIDNIYIFG